MDTISEASMPFVNQGLVDSGNDVRAGEVGLERRE